MNHYCTARTSGYCDHCDAAADRAAEYRAERDVERETWDDRALWSYTPDFGDQLTRGGY